MFIQKVLGQLLCCAFCFLALLRSSFGHHDRMINLLKNILTVVAEVLLQRIPLFCGLREF